MGRPAMTRVHELELAVARAEARAESAERLLETVLRAAFPHGVPTASAGLAPQPVVQADAKPEALPALTPAVRALCRKFGATQQQFTINWNVAQDLARQGKSEMDILKAIHLGAGEVAS